MIKQISIKIILVSLFLVSQNSIAQQDKSHKKISNLDLGFPLMEIEEDYGLRIGKSNIIPIQVNKKHYDQRIKSGSNEWLTELKLESSITFDKNLKKVKISKVISNKTTTTYNFNYDSKGRLLKYWSVGAKYGDKYENYSYQDKENFTKTMSFKEDGYGIKEVYKKTDYGYVINGDSKQKLFTENNLVKKKVYGYDSAEPSETLYTHDSNGKLVKTESTFSIVTNKYYSNGDIMFMKETSKSDGNYTARNYAYKYDKFGNWIIKVSLLDMSIAKGIPSYPQPTLREITYSNGDVTGTTDITEVESDLVSLRKDVENIEITNTGNQNVSWKKTNADKFYVYIDNNPVQKAKLSYMDSHIIVYIEDNNQLYLLENYKNATLNSTYSAKKIDINTSNGYWFRKPKGGVTVFTKEGKVIQKSSLYEYAPNQIDVFYRGEGEPNKVVLENYKNALSYKVFPAIAFSNYKAKTNNTIVSSKPDGTCISGDCNNGYGEYKYASSGKTAKGFFSNGKPNGPILLESSNIKDAVFSSYAGSYDKNDAFTYEYDGKNTVYFYDKNLTTGFANDSKKKETYKLIFKNRKVVSKQLLKYNGDTGCMLGDCSNGIGVYKYNNSAFYFGTFVNGKRSGFGKIDFPNGTYYIGEFSNDQYNGLGSYTWSEFNHYFGQYKNGKYHGKGVMYYNKTRFDAGNWVDGTYRGKTITTSNTNISINTNNSTSVKGFNTFSENEKTKVLACKSDSECVANYFSELYDKNVKILSESDLSKKMTDYFHSVYSINPKLAYNMCFDLRSDVFDSVDRESLPQAIQTDLKNRAQNLMNAYNKFKKSKGN